MPGCLETTVRPLERQEERSEGCPETLCSLQLLNFVSVNALELDQAGSFTPWYGMKAGELMAGKGGSEFFKPTGKTALMATMACFSGR